MAANQQQWQQQPQYPQQGYQQQPQYPGQYGYPQQQQQQPQYPGQQQYPAQQQQQYPPQQQYPQQQQQQYPQPQQQQYPSQQQQQYPPEQQAQAQQPSMQPQPVQQEAPPPAPGGSNTRRRDRPPLLSVTPVTQKMRQERHLNELINPMTKEKFTDDELNDARNEHNYNSLSMGDSVADNKAELGYGMLFYFEFVRFLGLVNIIFFVLQFIHYIVYATSEDPSFSPESNTIPGTPSPNGAGAPPPVRETRSWYHDFMITKYTDSQKDAWIALNVIAILFCFAAAPLYYWIMRKREHEEMDGKEVQYIMVRFNENGTVDVSNNYRSQTSLVVRRFLAFIMILMFLGIQVVASYFITDAQRSASFSSSLGISIIVVTLNGIFRLAAQFLTEFEKWDTYGKWKKYHTVKLLFFKLGNIVTVYSAKNYEATTTNQCIYDVIGEQFITLLLTEIIGMNLLEIIFSMVWSSKHHAIAAAIGSVLGDEDLKAPFDLALQYLTSVYRQYLCILAMVVCPCSVGLSVFGFFVQYWVDKFRLFKVCGRPKKMATSQKEFLAGILVCIAIVSMATPYAGSVWILSGATNGRSSLDCGFP